MVNLVRQGSPTFTMFTTPGTGRALLPGMPRTDVESRALFRWRGVRADMYARLPARRVGHVLLLGETRLVPGVVLLGPCESAVRSFGEPGEVVAECNGVDRTFEARHRDVRDDLLVREPLVVVAPDLEEVVDDRLERIALERGLLRLVEVLLGHCDRNAALLRAHLPVAVHEEGKVERTVFQCRAARVKGVVAGASSSSLAGAARTGPFNCARPVSQCAFLTQGNTLSPLTEP